LGLRSNAGPENNQTFGHPSDVFINTNSTLLASHLQLEAAFDFFSRLTLPLAVDLPDANSRAIVRRVREKQGFGHKGRCP
jgi:hypothetical protein